MGGHPLVSIVTPSYNQGRFLEETIVSLLDQDYPNLEYLVIDGGSTDGSVEVIHRYAKHLAYWVSEPDRGQSHAINKGLRRATGEILGWVNSDDVLAADTVSRAVTLLTIHPEVDVVYGQVDRMDEQGRSIPTPRLPKDVVLFGRQVLPAENLVNSPGAFWRRRIMVEVGLLDEGLWYAMDYEWWLRMAMAGAVFARMAGGSVARQRIGAHAKTVSRPEESALEALGVLDRLCRDPELGWKLSISARELSRRERRVRAYYGLHVCYGYLQQPGRRLEAARWLLRAAALWPPVVFRGQWWRLGIARLQMRVRDRWGGEG